MDRQEAVARAQDVTELVAHVQNPALVANMLTMYSLALMQNVDEKTSKDVSELRELEEGPMLIRQQLHAAREKAAAQQHHLAPRAESEGALS